MIVKTFKPQFAPKVYDGTKGQTCRQWPRRRDGTVDQRLLPKPYRQLSLRQWTGRPYGSPQRVLRDTVAKRLAAVVVSDEGVCVQGRTLPPGEREAFAKADGFHSFADMLPPSALRSSWLLRKGGHLWLVANRHLPYEAALARHFREVRAVADERGYKIVEARK